MPSVCGSQTCSPGYSGDSCELMEEDKVPPTVEYCPPGDIWVAAPDGTAFVSWDDPIFADNVRVDRVVNAGGLKPGRALQWGTYDVAYVAYDKAGNAAQCAFKIYVLSELGGGRDGSGSSGSGSRALGLGLGILLSSI